MPQNILVDPKTFAIIALASVGHEVASFMVQIPPVLLLEAQKRALNLGIQYGAIAVGQAAVGSNFVDLAGPSKLFVEGLQALNNASSPEEAAARGTVAAAALAVSAAASGDANASLTYGGFLIVFMQNILLLGGGGSQAMIISNTVLKIHLLFKLFIRIVTEIRIERKRLKLNLPRAKFKFNLFRREKRRDFVFKYPRIKKRKLKILSREISFPVSYQKERIFKHSPMIQPISLS